MVNNVDIVAVANLYDTLVKLDANANVVPSVAKSWQHDASGKVWTFALRDDVKFHNGDPLTSDDVAFSLKRMLKMGQGMSYLFSGTIDSFSAPDLHTFVVKLKAPYAPFIATVVWLPIVNKKQVIAHEASGPYGSDGDYGSKWMTTHDAGSGPYTVQKMDIAQSLAAVRAPSYWGGLDAAAPEGFQLINAVEPITVRTMMSQKNLSITDEWQPAANYKAMAQLPGVKVANMRTGSLLILLFNTSKPPVDDVHFRRALSYAFDYGACQEEIFPTGWRTNGPVGITMPGGDPSAPLLTRDVAKAKEELSQSKYANELSKYPVTIDVCSEVPDEERVALLLQSNARDIGITVKIAKMPWLSMANTAAKASTTPQIFTNIFSFVPYVEAGAQYESVYLSGARGTVNNPHWFPADVQAKFDDLITAASRTLDKEQRFAKDRAVEKMAVDLAVDIWPVELPTSHAYQDYVVWPAAIAAEKGEFVNPVPQYIFDFRSMRISR
jgi:peptide/nickel transport system substrate-binding protein